MSATAMWFLVMAWSGEGGLAPQPLGMRDRGACVRALNEMSQKRTGYGQRSFCLNTDTGELIWWDQTR